MHVAVTGASSGIGEGLVRAYIRAGAKVTMVARSQHKMEAIAKHTGGEVQILTKDLSVVDTACDWLQEAEAGFGPIDVLINNAGVQIVASLVSTDPADGARLLDLDLLVPLQLMRAILPGMLGRKQGTIINIASLAGIAPTPGMYYYNAAKAGLGAASEALRGELRKTGVNVLTVYPGPVDTPMAQAAYEAYDGTAPRALTWFTEGNTDQLADRILRAAERRKARLIYPRMYVLARHLPGITRFLLDRFAPPAPVLPPKD